MEGVDRLNDLKDEMLVNNIMSRLDCTTKELIRTTATISKRWKNLWTQLPHLIFSDEDDITDFGCDDIDTDICDYISFIENTLNQCRANLNLKKFILDINYSSRINSEFKSQANSWIRYAISRNVEDVDLADISVINRLAAVHRHDLQQIGQTWRFEHHDHTHDPGVSSVSIVCEGTLDLEKANFWLGTLLMDRSEDIYRMKGLLSIDGMDERFVFQGVHDIFQGSPDRPWNPDEPRVNKIVFIGKNLDAEELEKGFKTCVLSLHVFIIDLQNIHLNVRRIVRGIQNTLNLTNGHLVQIGSNIQMTNLIDEVIEMPDVYEIDRKLLQTHLSILSYFLLIFLAIIIPINPHQWYQRGVDLWRKKLKLNSNRKPTSDLRSMKLCLTKSWPNCRSLLQSRDNGWVGPSDGIALQWHRWITKFRGPMTWAEFSKAVLVRFGPTEYEDPAEALSRLKQTTTVASYQEAFEKISHQVDGLPETFLVGCFIGGLKEEIRLEVKLKTPRNLTEAIGMALLVEEKLNLQRRGSTSQRFSALTAPSRSTTTQGILGPSPNQRLAIPAPNPIRRLSQTEARERREKGLCYYCDERYTPGHKCSKPQLFMISDVSEVEDEESLGDNQEQNPGDSHVEISFHAISGSINPQTLRLPGKINNKEVVVLIDGGSTHNFVDQALVDRLGLVVEKDTPLKVVVGNREHVTCTGRVRALTIVIQGYVISTDFFVLPVAACPIVLGVQWLKTLGPGEMDYEQLTIGFHLAGSSHKLQGLKGSELAALKTHELMGIQGTTLFLQITPVPTEDPPKRLLDRVIPT
ncbi:transposon ty3-G gag-pol polyprotein [Tanacetum coccineum]